MILSNSNPVPPSLHPAAETRSGWCLFRRVLSAGAIFVACAQSWVPVHAVVIFGSAGADPNHNTTAPGGALSGSGWQFGGSIGGFLAYPIAADYFVAAQHIGGGAGSVLNYQGNNYTADAAYVPPTAADLRIFHVTTPFPSWTPLYTASDELNKDFVVFGNGAARGAEVNLSGASPTDLRGWLWGGSDFRTRWGQNTVEAIQGTGSTSLLVSFFDRNGFAEEATVSSGDSSGGVFINDGGVWKLAGLVLGVQAEFSVPPAAGFLAAIFDAGGLRYLPTNTDVPDVVSDVPAAFAATRISSNLDWILTVVPEATPRPWFYLGFTGVAAASWVFRRQQANR